MELTKKCKADFEKWFLLKEYEDYYIENDNKTGVPTYEGRYMHYQGIEDFPDSMKYSVYVDFFDSKSLTIFIDFYHVKQFKYSIWNYYVNVDGFQGYLTRKEARTEAIKKANTLYNKKHQETLLKEIIKGDEELGIYQKPENV